MDKVILKTEHWTLIESYNPQSNITILTTRRDDVIDYMDIYFFQNTSIGFQNNKCIYETIRIHIDSITFSADGYFNDFIDNLKDTQDFVNKANKYAKDNGFILN